MRTLLLALALMASVALAGCATKPCGPRTPIASLPLIGPPHIPLIRAKIGDRSVVLLVDTGAEVSLLIPKVAGELALRVDTHTYAIVEGVGGSKPINLVRADEFSLAGLDARSVHFIVVPLPINPGSFIEGLLGLDVLGDYAIDLDASARRMDLYAADRCATLPASWHGGATIIAPPTLDRRFMVPVTLDTRRAWAVLDSGAQTTLLKASVAAGLPLGADAGPAQTSSLSD